MSMVGIRSFTISHKKQNNNNAMSMWLLCVYLCDSFFATFCVHVRYFDCAAQDYEVDLRLKFDLAMACMHDEVAYNTVKPEIFATDLFSLISRVQKIRENKK